MTDYDENLAREDTLFTLAVLDLETGELIDTCIPSGHSRTSGAFEFSFDFLPAPIWSSDGKSLVISANMRIEEPQSGAEMDEDGNKIPYSDPGGVTQDLVLVDLETMTAYQLPSDWIPIGWLLPED